MILTGTAYAKINLFLNVDGLAEDGYHLLSSVMQTISLGDRLALDLQEGPGEIEIKTNVDTLPVDASNIVYRAIEKFYEMTGIERPGISVVIDKKIPVGAGLAGGSADAACVLRLLNAHYGNPIPETQWMKFAATIGADVPFCIHGGTSLCQGIGEKITYLSPLKNLYILVSVGKESKSTAASYQYLDTKTGGQYAPQSENVEKMVKALTDARFETVAQSLYNQFGEITMDRFREAPMQMRILQECHALNACMTGSGPAVYGLFDDEKKALVTRDILKAFGYKVFLCEPIPSNNSN